MWSREPERGEAERFSVSLRGLATAGLLTIALAGGWTRPEVAAHAATVT